VRVMHDLLADVDGRAVLLQGAFDGLNGPVDPRAVTTRFGEEDSLARRW
jgi:hypothetical protein